MTKNTKPKPAARGRPDAASSRDVEGIILEVAEKCFAECGYSATPMREIADQASVNPAMIHYYFGNKESLLKAVLERALMPLAVIIESMQASKSVSPGEIIEALMGTVGNHPYLPYLVMREVMLPGGVMQEHFASNLAPRLGGALPGLLSREIEHKRMRNDLSPQVAALAIMSLAIFPFVVRPVAEKVLNVRLSGQALDAFKSQISEIVSRGLKP